MAGAARNLAGWSRWLIGAGWMAGISLALVEMQIGMDYVQARVVEHARMMADWLPMVGTLVCRFAGPFVQAPQGVQSLTRMALFTAIPVALAVAGWVIKGPRIRETRHIELTTQRD